MKRTKQIVVAALVAIVLSLATAQTAQAWWNCWAPGVCDWIDE